MIFKTLISLDKQIYLTNLVWLMDFGAISDIAPMKKVIFLKIIFMKNFQKCFNFESKVIFLCRNSWKIFKLFSLWIPEKYYFSKNSEKYFFAQVNFQSVSISNPKYFLYAEILEKYSNCFHCKSQKNIILAKFWNFFFGSGKFSCCCCGITTLLTSMALVV